MFKCKGCEVLREEILLLRTLLSDAEYRAERDSLANKEQTKALLDKILALSNPGALAMLPENRKAPQAKPEQPQAPFRPHYPGFRPDLRPEKVEPLVEAPRTLKDYQTKSTLPEVATKKN